MAEVCGSIQEPTSPDTLQAPLYMQGEKGGSDSKVSKTPIWSTICAV